MTWEDIRNRKEDSIRESMNNPNPRSFKINNVSYNSFSDYIKSEEYQEELRLQEEAKEEYKKKAKEYFDSLDMDNKLLLFFHITNSIYENYFESNGSYRGLLYDKLGFGPESYSLGLDSGMFNVHNSISTPDENENRFVKLVEHLKLNLSKKELRSLRHIFLYGFDNTKSIDDLDVGQQKFDFTKDPE